MVIVYGIENHIYKIIKPITKDIIEAFIELLVKTRSCDLISISDVDITVIEKKMMMKVVSIIFMILSLY
jgi:hypothetical protein